jgi:hypothetical protein
MTALNENENVMGFGQILTNIFHYIELAHRDRALLCYFESHPTFRSRRLIVLLTLESMKRVKRITNWEGWEAHLVKLGQVRSESRGCGYSPTTGTRSQCNA